MAPKREVGEEDASRWERLRLESHKRHLDLLREGPSEPLDALAWKAGSVVDDRFAFDNDLRLRVQRARDARYTWREIAAALGEGEDEDAARRVSDQQKWRDRAFRKSQEG